MKVVVTILTNPHYFTVGARSSIFTTAGDSCFKKSYMVFKEQRPWVNDLGVFWTNIPSPPSPQRLPRRPRNPGGLPSHLVLNTGHCAPSSPVRPVYNTTHAVTGRDLKAKHADGPSGWQLICPRRGNVEHRSYPTRIINTHTLELEDDRILFQSSYAIFSYTWGAQEVTYDNVREILQEAKVAELDFKLICLLDELCRVPCDSSI
jgi:hypothetical protein